MRASAIPIQDIMTEQPLTIGRSETLGVAARMMRENGIRHLPVLEHGELIGMLSERDLGYLERAGKIDLSTSAVERGMSTDTYAVGPGETLDRVADVMAERKLGSAVVVDALRLLANEP
jgi:acetoin utilization protein AcuB